MGKYGVIVADPPWEFKTWSKIPLESSRNASLHYKLMTREQIAELRPMIDDISDQDCALFLWATYPNIVDAFDIMYEWGFEFKTVCFTWVKTTKITHVSGDPIPLRLYKDLYVERTVYDGEQIEFDDTDVYESVELRFHMGTGLWTRANPEIVLLGTRGKPQRSDNRSVRNLLLSPVGAHSEKPDEMFRRVELLMLDQRRIELFARKPRDGWDVWGDEV